MYASRHVHSLWHPVQLAMSQLHYPIAMEFLLWVLHKCQPNTYFVYIVQCKLALCIPSLTLQSDYMIHVCVCVCVAVLKLLSDCDACASAVVISAHKHSEHS